MQLEVEKILKEKDISYRLIELSGRAVTHEDVIKYTKGANPEGDCKTIITKDKKGNQYAFLLRGMMRIDFSKAKEIVGQKIGIISYEDLEKATGKEPGTICPLILKNTKMFVDKRVFQQDKIHFGSGDHRFGLEISSKDLGKIIEFEIVDVAQE
jgi:Ala-tRNA(Pro) deacylase